MRFASCRSASSFSFSSSPAASILALFVRFFSRLVLLVSRVRPSLANPNPSPGLLCCVALGLIVDKPGESFRVPPAAAWSQARRVRTRVRFFLSPTFPAAALLFLVPSLPLFFHCSFVGVGVGVGVGGFACLKSSSGEKVSSSGLHVGRCLFRASRRSWATQLALFCLRLVRYPSLLGPPMLPGRAYLPTRKR